MNWTVAFRKALDENGFNETLIILPDGPFSNFLAGNLSTDPALHAAVDGVGLHYPCQSPHPEVQLQLKKKYWASEDFNTANDWDGAECWARLLSENFIFNNMTATIAWALIWSVYPYPQITSYWNNGLMNAYGRPG